MTDAVRLPQMNENSLIDLLEELAEGFGVKIRHEAIKQDEDAVYVSGGLCLLRGKYVLILDSHALWGPEKCLSEGRSKSEAGGGVKL